jgi:hypothetical protein
MDTCTLRVIMDLESITLYLNKKYLSAVVIHAEINSVLGEGTIGYSTVTHDLRKQSFANASHVVPEEPDLGAADTIDNALLQVFDEQPHRLSRNKNRPESLHQNVSWICWVQSSTRAGNIL